MVRRNIFLCFLFILLIIFSLILPWGVTYGHGQEGEEAPEAGKWSNLFFLPIGLLALLIALSLALILRGRKGAVPRPAVELGGLSNSFKFLITVSLVIFGCVHLIALFNVYLHTRVESSSVGEYFSFMELWELVSLTHVHLFGHLVMYLLIGFVFLLTHVEERLKIAVISLSILGGYVDALSWWLIKYVSSGFEIMSLLSGAAFTIGFLIMSLAILYELWVKRRV